MARSGLFLCCGGPETSVTGPLASLSLSADRIFQPRDWGRIELSRSSFGIFGTPIGGSFGRNDDLAADPLNARPATGSPFFVEPASTDPVCGTKFSDREGERNKVVAESLGRVL
jgi:hypothetical protein